MKDISSSDLSLLINILLAIPIVAWCFEKVRVKLHPKVELPPEQDKGPEKLAKVNVLGATPAVFSKGEPVRHLKTGGEYVIVGLPDEYVLEHDRQPAYAYRMSDGRICVRCQSEMEDGRFVSMNWGNSQFPWWQENMDRRKARVSVEVDRRIEHATGLNDG